MKKSSPAFLLSCLTGVLLLLAGKAGAQESANPASIKEYKVAAYIWPSCHDEPRSNSVLWPEGTGEWEIIRKGTPRFEGHYQPKVPLWGYEMDDDPNVMEKWIDAATSHGINIFIFDWYWFDDQPFLENSLNNGFLKAANNREMDFYIMWANHDVKRNYWNVHRYKDDDSQLWDGAVDFETFKHIVERVIRQYFHRSNYFKIDGKPVFSIFSIYNLLEGFGSVEKTRDALDYFRKEVRNAGFPDLHLQLIVFGNPNPDLVGQIEKLGINSVTKYNWGGPHPEDYIAWHSQALKQRENWDDALSIPYFANASIGWDDSPRFPGKGAKDIVHYNNTPVSFAASLQMAKNYCDNHPEQIPLITVYSWNEWIEGSYLLPDMKNGFEYLKAVKNVMNGSFDRWSGGK